MVEMISERHGMSSATTILSLLTFVTVGSCTQLVPSSIPLDLPEAELVLSTIISEYWDPRVNLKSPGLACLPMPADARLNIVEHSSGDHLAHHVDWSRIDVALSARLQSVADRIYAESDQSSGKLLSIAHGRAPGSMRRLEYSAPIMIAPNIAAVCISYSMSPISVVYQCVHLERYGRDEWRIVERVDLLEIG